MIIYANLKRVKGLTLKKGDKVYLWYKNIKTTRLSDKLDYKFLEPFKIIKKLSEINYKLDLPLGMKIYLVFHIAFFEFILLNAKLEINIKFINKLLESKVKVIINLR